MMTTHANTNSASPYAPITPGEHWRYHQTQEAYAPAPSMLMAIITTIHIVIQAAGLIELFQYPIRIEAALVLKEINK